MHRRTTQQRALVLILVLWVLVVLAVLTVTLVQDAKMDNAIRIAASDRTLARWLARSGVNQALAVLQRDELDVDTSADNWYDDPHLFRRQVLTGGYFSVLADRPDELERQMFGLVDESSKLNVNVADRQALLALPGMTEDAADGIIARRHQIPSGAQSDPAALAAALDTGAAGSQLGQIATLRELMQIRGLTQSTLFGEDRNLNGILETNENDGTLLPPDDNKDGVLNRGILAYITTSSYNWNRDAENRPRINLNTATANALVYGLGLDIPNAKWIIEQRIGSFASIADILPENATFTQDILEKSRATPPSSGKTDSDSSGKSVAAGRTLSAGATTESTPVDISATKQWLQALPRPIDGDTFRLIADRITVTDADRLYGHININTAGKVVLDTLPGIDSQMAEQIAQHRLTLANGFTSTAELLLVKGMTVDQFRSIAELICVRGNVFTVRSCGQTERTGIRHWIEAVVDRGTDKPTIIYWRETH